MYIYSLQRIAASSIRAVWNYKYEKSTQVHYAIARINIACTCGYYFSRVIIDCIRRPFLFTNALKLKYKKK